MSREGDLKPLTTSPTTNISSYTYQHRGNSLSTTLRNFETEDRIPLEQFFTHKQNTAEYLTFLHFPNSYCNIFVIYYIFWNATIVEKWIIQKHAEDSTSERTSVLKNWRKCTTWRI